MREEDFYKKRRVRRFLRGWRLAATFVRKKREGKKFSERKYQAERARAPVNDRTGKGRRGTKQRYKTKGRREPKGSDPERGGAASTRTRRGTAQRASTRGGEGADATRTEGNCYFRDL